MADNYEDMADKDKQLSQDDLDALLNNPTETVKDENNFDNVPLGIKDQTGVGLDQSSLDELVSSLGSDKDKEKNNKSSTDASIADLQNLSDDSAQEENVESIDLLKDVTLRFTVELGRTEMLIKDVLKLDEGSALELNRDAGNEVDILVNERFFGKGKLKIVDRYFGVQILKIEKKIENPK